MSDKINMQDFLTASTRYVERTVNQATDNGQVNPEKLKDLKDTYAAWAEGQLAPEPEAFKAFYKQFVAVEVASHEQGYRASEQLGDNFINWMDATLLGLRPKAASEAILHESDLMARFESSHLGYANWLINQAVDAARDGMDETWSTWPLADLQDTFALFAKGDCSVEMLEQFRSFYSDYVHTNVNVAESFAQLPGHLQDNYLAWNERRADGPLAKTRAAGDDVAASLMAARYPEGRPERRDREGQRRYLLDYAAIRDVLQAEDPASDPMMATYYSAVTPEQAKSATGYEGAADEAVMVGVNVDPLYVNMYAFFAGGELQAVVPEDGAMLEIDLNHNFPGI